MYKYSVVSVRRREYIVLILITTSQGIRGWGPLD